MPGAGAVPVDPGRARFRRQRARALAAGVAVATPLGMMGALLAAPGDLAAVRLAGVSVAWWAALAAHLLALVALALGRRAPLVP